MKTRDYIKKYKLDDEEIDYFTRDSKDSFLKDLALELEGFISERLNKEGNLPYSVFHGMIKQINQKFWAISNKRCGNAFTGEFWNAFYAIHIVRLREKYFPNESKSTYYSFELKTTNVKPNN